MSGVSSTLRLFARAFAYVAPAKGALALKAALMLAAALPLLLLPWPVKLIVDHVIEGIPLGAQPLPHPAFIDALFAPFAGSREDLLFACVLFQLALALLIGAVGQPVESLPPGSYVVVGLTFLAGIAATIMQFRYADNTQ